MKDIFDKTIEEHGSIIIARYTSRSAKIEHRNTVTRTEGGMYILEDLTIDRNEMVHQDEHINTWDFEEVKLWCMEAIIAQKINEEI